MHRNQQYINYIIAYIYTYILTNSAETENSRTFVRSVSHRRLLRLQRRLPQLAWGLGQIVLWASAHQQQLGLAPGAFGRWAIRMSVSTCNAREGRGDGAQRDESPPGPNSQLL